MQSAVSGVARVAKVGGPTVWGSPVGAVGLALRAVNEVKLDRARLVLGWVTRLTVSIGLWLWADQLRP